MTRTIAMALLLMGLGPAAASAQLNEKWGVPGSPTGMMLARVLEMIDRGDDDYTRQMLEEHFAPEFVEAHPLEEHLSTFRRLHDDFPGVRPRGVMRTDQGARFGIVSEAREASGTITLEVGEDGLVTDMIVEVGGEELGGDLPLPELLDRWTEEDRFSGVVLDVSDGRPVFARAYGLANKRTDTPNTLDTRFNLGSLNKAFTAAAILLLEREGGVDLDAPIGRYLDGFPPDVAGSVTVRHLLRHRSGWEHYWEYETFRAELADMRGVSDYLDFIREMPLHFEPGTERRYSNVGYEVLGGIIEAVSGRSYYDFVADRVLEPLGMDDTGFFMRDHPTPRVAVGYTSGHPYAVEEGFTMENTFLLAPRGTPAGGAYATAEDVVRFFRGILEGRLLDRDAFALILNDFDEEASFPGGPSVLGGGGPGVRSMVLIHPDADRFAVALSNYDARVTSTLMERLEAGW